MAAKRKTEVRFRMAESCGDLKPAKAHPDDAAWDLRSRISCEILPGRVMLVPTGLFLELPAGFEAQIRPRSGLALKKYITLLNTPGTIDAGYRGEVSAIVFNTGELPFTVNRGDRIAQMVIQQLPEVVLSECSILSESLRGEGGFGSTGTK